MSTDTRQSTGQERKPQLRKAWWSLVSYPASVVLSFLMMYGLVASDVTAFVGVTPGPLWDVASWWDPLFVTGAMGLLFGISLSITITYSNRAATEGEAHARVPVVIAVIFAAGYVAFMLVPTIMWAFGLFYFGIWYDWHFM